MFVLYYIFSFNTTTILSISITCVNSMDASYIPIAQARDFTTHWINKVKKSLICKQFLCRLGTLLSLCVCKILAFYFCSSSHVMICLLFSYPITFRSVMKIGFSKSAKVTELMLLNLLASQRT